MSASQVEVFNVLPAALAHYEDALVDNLPFDSVRRVACSAERQDGPLPTRVVKQLVARVASTARTEPLLVVWPAFGLWDPLSWFPATARRQVFVVVHDPVPIREQRGHGLLARRAARWQSRGHLRLVTHSTEAAVLLREWGLACVFVPHPVRPRTAPLGSRSGPVVVLGQFKPTRDLVALEELAAEPELDGLRVLKGRGWAPLDGWHVDEGFLSEAAFAGTLASARCLVLPYKRYFQSGVAVRALEMGVPIVAPRHGFLETLLGHDWPGFVDSAGWMAALNRVSEVNPVQLLGHARSARSRSREGWAAVLNARTAL